MTADEPNRDEPNRDELNREDGAPERPFPPEPPASLTDPAAIRANDWQAFSNLTTLEDHWSLKAWATGYSAFYWYLTFDEEPLAALAEWCRSNLDTTCLDPVPSDGLHMTVLKVGSTDELTETDVARIVAAAEAALADSAPISLDVGPLTGSPSAIRFSVAPWNRLTELHCLLRETTITCRPEAAPAPTSRFRPHVGIAYHNRRRDAGPMVRSIAELRSAPPVTVTVGQVRLVRLWREGRRYRWQDRAVISLGSSNRRR
ncbi:2'-5' RNA ligase family protein [Nocardia farcinica]|uniref:2'-5' RNA ligase family protein n=1 Tax=Nocardia farcinica TaxID=37329 RepID=UPI0018944EA1|nr:2'-5' RNA ligase family protein [Nocardia farcinica]MBF6252982.1 2'-5' RNA ligase family protein [Nocardia farcinica]